MPFLGKNLGTKWKFRQCCCFEQPFSTARRTGKADGFAEKKGQIFIKIKSGRATLAKEKIYKCFNVMNLVSIVAFENFEWLLMTPAVICNNCNFPIQYWSNILSNEFLGYDIWTLPAMLNRVRYQWKVCYNKLKQGNFRKIDVGGESQDIYQELAVTSGHTKSFFSKILGRFLKTQRY